MNKNIPGLEDLRQFANALAAAEARYQAAFERMMEDEFNDGARAPQPVSEELREDYEWMVKTYPRAALYLRAESYTLSSNHHKYSAGKKAMQLIADGAPLEQAKAVLDNWLPETALWD